MAIIEIIPLIYDKEARDEQLRALRPVTGRGSLA